MVIGNGLMANAFSDYKERNDILIFASGVSNSLEIDQTEFDREFKLLKSILCKHPNCKLIYFSTVTIKNDALRQSPYIKHKIIVEKHIQSTVSNYLILRVSQVVGNGGNNHTIMNYLVSNVSNAISFDLWKSAERNIIDIEDVKYVVDQLLQQDVKNKIINIAMRENIKVIELVKLIEHYLNKKAKFNLIEKGGRLKIDVDYISETLINLEKVKGKEVQYISQLLEKYY